MSALRYTDSSRGIFYRRRTHITDGEGLYTFYVGRIGGDGNAFLGTVRRHGHRNIKITEVIGLPSFDPDNSPTFASLAKAGSWLYANGGPA